MHLARPIINGNGLPCLFLCPLEPSGTSHIRFSRAIGLNQFQFCEDMGRTDVPAMRENFLPYSAHI